MNVRIKLLHTAQHPHTAQRFYEGQKAALESFGIDAVDSIKNNWQNNPITYMLVCENALTGELCAGLRLDVVDPSHPIPLEEALLSLSPGIVPRIHKFDHVLAELCGLWVHEDYRGYKLPVALVRSAVSVCPKLRISVLLSFSALHSRPILIPFGFTPVTKLPNEAEFVYPTEEYKSVLLELELFGSYHMKREEYRVTQHLKSHPHYVLYDQIDGEPLTIEYDLRLI